MDSLIIVNVRILTDECNKKGFELGGGRDKPLGESGLRRPDQHWQEKVNCFGCA
jgi:hypothetical protein